MAFKHDKYDEEMFIAVIPPFYAKLIRELAQEYRTTPEGMVNIVLAYYFGDKNNHLQCEYCGNFDGEVFDACKRQDA